MKYLFYSILFYSICSITLLAEELVGRVVAIHDGDTINMIVDGKKSRSRIRLIGVDTPELSFQDQTQGAVAEVARDYLRSLLPLNSKIRVKLTLTPMDTNNRYLGQVIYKGVDLNREMLLSGWGAMYFIYPYDKSLLKNYSEAAELAYNAKKGIFSDQFINEALPYIFRQDVLGVPGGNLLGDIKSKKIYGQENMDKVLPFNRIFFPTEEMAKGQGYNW